MAEFIFPNQPFGDRQHVRLLGAIKHAAVSADYDSGWVSTSQTKVLNHNLGVVPGHVIVMTSDDPTGLNHQSDTYSACNRSSITVAGTKAYTRVRINKGD